MMKVIFLDIDGVLNSPPTWDDCHARNQANPGRQIDMAELVDDRHLVHLFRIIEETGAKIVISSTWRGFILTSPIDWHVLPQKGLDKHLHPIWRTRLHSGGIRGLEIEDWLKLVPGVDRFVILDDDSDMTEDQKAHNFVKTESMVGLQAEHADKAIEILNG